jgi:hypothetical protein
MDREPLYDVGLTNADIDTFLEGIGGSLPTDSPYIVSTFIDRGTLYAELTPNATRSNLNGSLPASLTVERIGNQCAELGVNAKNAAAYIGTTITR